MQSVELYGNGNGGGKRTCIFYRCVGQVLEETTRKSTLAPHIVPRDSLDSRSVTRPICKMAAAVGEQCIVFILDAGAWVRSLLDELSPPVPLKVQVQFVST